MVRQNLRTNSKSKAIQMKSHKEAACTYKLTKREKGKIYIYPLGSLRSSASVQ